MRRNPATLKQTHHKHESEAILTRDHIISCKYYRVTYLIEFHKIIGVKLMINAASGDDDKETACYYIETGCKLCHT